MTDKLVHRADKMNSTGGVSPLCAKRPRAIDLKTATWTNRDEAVTCPDCRNMMWALYRYPRYPLPTEGSAT